MKSEFGEFIQKQSGHFRFRYVLKIIQPLGSCYVAICYILQIIGKICGWEEDVKL